MSNHRIDDEGVNCEELQRAMREGRELTKDESTHVDKCHACTDIWLTAALDAKPEVAIPADFAARVRAMAPARPPRREKVRAPRHWGLTSAIAVVAVLLMVCFEGPKPANAWVGVVFVMVVASEIAGLALWLGPQWTAR